jgi:hypothetical protein
LSDCPPRLACTLALPVYCPPTLTCVSSRAACRAGGAAPPLPTRAPDAGCPPEVPLVCPFTGVCTPAASLAAGECLPINISALQRLDIQPCPASAPLLCASGACVRSWLSPVLASLQLPAGAAGLQLSACPLLAACNASAPVRCIGGPCVGAVEDCGPVAEAGGSLALALTAQGSTAPVPVSAGAALSCPLARPLQCSADNSSGVVVCLGSSEDDNDSGTARACLDGHTAARLLLGGSTGEEPSSAGVFAPWDLPCEGTARLRCPSAACVDVPPDSASAPASALLAALCAGGCDAGSVRCSAAPSLVASASFASGTCLPVQALVRDRSPSS